MRNDKGLGLFLIFAAGAAAFIFVTSLELPEPVASHFGATGAPNGFMPRRVYTSVMLVLAIGAPLLLVLLTWFAIKNPGARINLPNREFWLAPERRGQTVSFLRAHILRFAALLVSFSCYAHWLVVRANTSQPVRLAGSWFIGGLAVFSIAVLALAYALLSRFGRNARFDVLR